VGKLDDMRAAIAKSKAAAVPAPPPRAKKARPRTPKSRDAAHAAKGRLPDKASFLVAYDADRLVWSGNLTVPGLPAFAGEASGVFHLLATLDDRYREYLRGDHADRPG
jgi:hypothetical protein